MIQLDFIPSIRIIARVNGSLHHLMLHRTGGAAVLVNAANARFSPCEVQLIDWPPEAEADLRRGGYFPIQQPDMELWCNCAD
jgi:hypothetical protein